VFSQTLWKVGSLALLGLIILAAQALAITPPPAVSGMVGLGVLLLAGELGADLVERVGLPHMTGYLLSGLVVGPHLLGVVSKPAMESLNPINTLAIALIALSAGAELTWSLLTRGYRSLLASVAAQMLLVLPAAMGGLYLLRSRMPFLDGMPWEALIAVALIWGVIAISRSPSATLGVISQLKPEGPLTRQTLTVVIAFDIIVLVLFALTRNVGHVLTEPGATFSSGAARELMIEMVGAMACGTTLGLLIAVYLRVVGRELILFLLAVGYGATEFATYFRFEPMLLFLVAGFVVANVSRQGERLLESVAAGGRVVYVIFFALAGAHIDLGLLARIWPWALLLASVRIVTTWGACRLGSRWASDGEAVRRYGWMPLVSQAGVTIGMAVVLVEEFPRFGPGLANLTMAVVGLNEAIGPVLFKLALDRTGETGKAVPSAAERSGVEHLRGGQGEEQQHVAGEQIGVQRDVPTA
jgi:Kef-type K+ transport system membrane component KefB